MVDKTSSKKSSLLAKYTLLYQKKPKSRVFAPLAETYRKLAMYDESLKILREGIKQHPTYTLGYIVLAHVYFDQGNYELAYNTLRPFVTNNLENITLQKLFAEICINLGFLEEALQTFKYLLLINPKDHNVAQQVKLLEDDLLINDEANIKPGYIEKRMTSFDTHEEDWIQVDFNHGQRKEDDGDVQNWDMQDSTDQLAKIKKDLTSENLVVIEQDLNDDYFKEEYDNDDDEQTLESVKSDPIITHTLVDLYCKQGHFDKALEILESIIDLHPHDQATLDRIEKIKSTFAPKPLQSFQSNLTSIDLEQLPNKPEEDQTFNEENGYDQLEKLIEKKKKKDHEMLAILKKKLQRFSDTLKIEATKKQLNL